MSQDVASGAASGLYRIIVGVDYGTTFSGVSFVASNKDNVKDIVVITKWPNHKDKTWKAPSTIAYAVENTKHKLSRNFWGFETTPGLKQYAWTKLLLDKNADLTEFDDPLLKEMYGHGFLSIPSGKSAKDVVEDYLRELYKHTIGVLERELSAETLRTMPMECWITTPAIWTHGAQSATLEAAKAAGFGSRPNDVVNTISEPEAAALTALKPHLGPKSLDPVQPKECILVCDCGGGTVDITTLQIVAVHPTLKYKEICRGTGGKCGATSIDRHFIKWMTGKFGSAFTDVNMKKRGPGSLFMNAFDHAKINFGSAGNDRPFEIGPIAMDTPWSPLYDDDEEMVKLSKRDMASLFEPSLKEIIKLVETQVDLLRQKTGRKIDRFILVGGYADSEYLNRKLKEFCKRNDIKRFYCPEDCQAAIVKGAALRGLEGITPSVTIAKRHYGWSWGEAFRPGIDEEANAYTQQWSNEKYCRGKMHWPIRKDQELDETTVSKITMTLDKAAGEEIPSYELKLYSTTFATPPEREEHYSVIEVGTITTDLSGIRDADVESRFNSQLGRTVYQYQWEVEVRFRSQEGNLAFRTIAYGREGRTTTIRYAD